MNKLNTSINHNSKDTSLAKSRIHKPSFHHEISQYITQLDSLAETWPLTIYAIDLIAEKSIVDADQLKHFPSLPNDIPADHYRQALRVYKRVERANTASDIISQSFVVSLVSLYDAFLGAILRVIFLLKSESLNLSNIQISYADLVEYKTVEDARNHIIEKEIETVLRKSHLEQIKWVENKFDIKLKTDSQLWVQFFEITERRNLFVHSSGKVSQQYLSACKSTQYSHKYPVARGDTLGVPDDYFPESHECVTEVGFELAHTLWRKIFPEDRKAADSDLSYICYELLVEERYKLAQKLLKFGIGQKKFFSDHYRRTLIINYAQSLKWDGDSKGAVQVVEGEDWSACANEFKLAEAVLLNDIDRAIAIMRQIGPSSIPSMGDYCEWPLFKEFRKDSKFSSAFSELFNIPFEEALKNSQMAIYEQKSEIQKDTVSHSEAEADELDKSIAEPT